MIVGRQPVRTIPGTISPVPSLPRNRKKSAKSNYSRTYEPFSSNSNYSRTYAIPRGWGLFPGPIFKFHFLCPAERFSPRISTKSTSSPTYKIPAGNSFLSPSYAKTGGYCLPQKCRRAAIFDFSPDISYFFAVCQQPASEGGRCNGKRVEQAQPLQVPKWDIGGASKRVGRLAGIAWWMAAQMLLCFADRGRHERSCARGTDGGDDPG